MFLCQNQSRFASDNWKYEHPRQGGDSHARWGKKITTWYSFWGTATRTVYAFLGKNWLKSWIQWWFFRLFRSVLENCHHLGEGLICRVWLRQFTAVSLSVELFIRIPSVIKIPLVFDRSEILILLASTIQSAQKSPARSGRSRRAGGSGSPPSTNYCTYLNLVLVQTAIPPQARGKLRFCSP